MTSHEVECCLPGKKYLLCRGISSSDPSCSWLCPLTTTDACSHCSCCRMKTLFGWVSAPCYTWTCSRRWSAGRLCRCHSWEPPSSHWSIWSLQDIWRSPSCAPIEGIYHQWCCQMELSIKGRDRKKNKVMKVNMLIVQIWTFLDSLIFKL